MTAQLPEMAIFFERDSGSGLSAAAGSSARLQGIKIGSLRRIKSLAGMEERQLESFIQYMEVDSIQQFAEVFRRGQPSDAMYFVLEGELRARVLVDGKETTLSTMTAGDFFGEISLLDHGPRSADVVANRDSRLLKISAAAVEKVMGEARAPAASFLHGWC